MVLLISSAEHSKLDLSPAEKKSPAASLAVVNAVEMPVYLSLGKNPDQEIKKNTSELLLSPSSSVNPICYPFQVRESQIC